MSYADFFIKKARGKVLEKWDFPYGYFLAYCETTHLEDQQRFYVLFSEYFHMQLPDEIGDKLSGKKKGMKNDHASEH